MRASRLFRFPVKGFPAEEIAEAVVDSGRGIRGDRVAAFTNGSLNVPADQWQRYSAFTVLKNYPDLQKWQVSTAPDSAITLTAPAGGSTTFCADDDESRAASAEFLSSHIPPQGSHPRGIVVAGQGMFDSRESGISLINPATVEALGATEEGRAALGTGDLDPLRFRGNIFVEGLDPFAEFGLIGRIVRIGGVRLAISQAIERCPATTVNPVTTEVDVNVPRILASACGHLHCGVYGRILESGTITAGDEIVVEGEAPRDLVPTARTPRFLTVVSSRQICNDTVEISLRDELGWIRDFDEPGTNLRVHLELGAPFWRTYTITDVTDDVVSIAVRTQGKGSRAVASLPPGERVLASGPHGTMTADRVFGGTTALVTAGIGITPSLGLLREVAREPMTVGAALGVGGDSAAGVGPGSADGAAAQETLGRAVPAAERLRLLHIDRDQRTACLWNRLVDRAEGTGLPVEAEHRDTAVDGRPGHDDLVATLSGCDNVMVCGPADFTRAVLAAAEEAGVPGVHQETFASPHTGMSEAIADCEPAEVTLAESGTSFLWEPAQGTLLDALESRGVHAESSCRGGSCGTCSIALASGTVLYPVEPAARVPADHVLACSAVPAGPISLAL
ncbi:MULTISPECIES: MOSC domain-containing protein [Brevibacterium]|uniref:MOSC domain-containing protein n=4 Tax=Bacteria TaxID=2 RepID=K9B3G1_9MICO|nr:2Fe-2S iron-sulfur cluster-binding protein [Brevibacterium casei]EKU48310.1 MOSC domain-containing protein [Brevibacterium casei S18]MCT1765315.1 MOSC domain-containing protein [Brevibacterium casei]MCT2182216.1 MOSC domain-containing protein [Brevibacterium casei]MDH5148119.1 MOSC domain-containing protein [Brevibacterium casei]PAK96752.1 sulfurase [Brevibacterium casei]